MRNLVGGVMTPPYEVINNNLQGKGYIQKHTGRNV